MSGRVVCDNCGTPMETKRPGPQKHGAREFTSTSGTGTSSSPLSETSYTWDGTTTDVVSGEHHDPSMVTPVIKIVTYVCPECGLKKQVRE
jgi:hypothetical protein